MTDILNNTTYYKYLMPNIFNNKICVRLVMIELLY